MVEVKREKCGVVIAADKNQINYFIATCHLEHCVKECKLLLIHIHVVKCGQISCIHSKY